MNKTFLAVTAALAISISSFGQQSSQSDMKALARALVEFVPEIDMAIVKMEERSKNNICCFLQGIEEDDVITLQIYRYQRPAAATDLAVAAFDIVGAGLLSWVRCFSIDRKTGALAETKLPFEIPPPSQFSEEFGEDHGYWHIGCSMFDNGNLLIDASPGMSYHCLMLARHNGNGAFTLFKRAAYNNYADPGEDNAETEKYVQNVVRPNFQRINAISKWAYVEAKDIYDLSTEGAKHTCYYSESGLEKIVVKLYGETGAKTIEYYFLDRKLSFVYDVATNNATNAKTERRWYLKGFNCIRGIGDNGKKLTPAQIEEEFLYGGGDNGAYSLYTGIIGL